MKFKFINLSFLILMISNIMIFLSNSWFFLWMIMEINLICFLKILSTNKNFNSELLMNYFLIQSFNSYLFLMSSMMINLNFLETFMKIMLLISLMCKMGLPPFIMWYTKMMINLNCWMMFFINSCIQKFIPLMVINNFFSYKLMNIFFFCILFILTIPFMGLNSFNIWLMMTISSIMQTLWMLIFMSINEMWIIYFILYSLISLSIMMIFKFYNIIHFLDIFIIKSNNFNNFYLLNINIMSLGGLPPFLGFLMKFIYIWNLIKMNMLLMFLLIIMSLINLFFYLRLISYSLMKSFNSKNNIFKFLNFYNNKNFSMIFMWFFSLMGLTLAELI